MLETRISTKVYNIGTKDKDIDCDKHYILDLLIENRTAATVFINESYPLLTGESLRISCNEGERITGVYKINFKGAAGNVVVTFRIADGVNFQN